MFWIVFWYKWCAALSSVVLHGGPEGQKICFNANVVWKSILRLVVSFTYVYSKKWPRKRFLQYFMLKIDGFKTEFALKTFVNFRVFRRLMSPKLSQNQKFPKHPKLVLEYSRVCFEKFFDTNGAQHSPPSYFLGAPKGRISSSTQMWYDHVS